MPIEGALRELDLTDLLQLVHLSRKTGTLTVRGARTGRAARLEFDRGAVVGAQGAGDAPRLGDLLVVAGKATQGQVDRALAEQRSAPGRRLGEILVESHGLPRAEVERQLRFQVEETVFDLVRWSDGDFRFEETPTADAGPITLRISTEGLLLESLRRMDEWSALASAPLDTDLMPALVEAEPESRSVLALQPAEWEVLAAVDGERTLRAIGHLLGRAEFDVARAVFSLVSAGVVELRHRRGAGDALTGAALHRRPEAEVETALREGRLEEAERGVDDLLRRHPERGELHALRGEIEARRGEWRRALECLESAIRCDPLLGRAYYALGMAALRTGEAARAREALGTYLRLPEPDPRRRARAARAVALAAELQKLFQEDGE
jgi:tetratricopeptide (TPR) repeat protein